MSRVEERLASAAPWFLALYLLFPPLFKAALQPLAPVDLTVLLAIPTATIGVAWVAINRSRLGRHQLLAASLWLGLTALVIFGVMWAPDRGIAARTVAYFVLLGALPLLAAFPVAADQARVRQFLLAFFGAGAVLVAIGTVALFTGDLGGRELIGANRLSVARALLLVPLIGMPVLAWHRRFGPGMWTLILISSVALFVGLATSSRAALIFALLLGLGMAVGSVLWSRRRRDVLARAAALAGCTAIVFVAMSGLLPQHSPARFGLLFDAVVQIIGGEEPSGDGEVPGATPSGDSDPGDDMEVVGGESVAVRVALFSRAWEAFLDHPLVGVGTGGFEIVTATADIEGDDYPHNLVLHFASDFGVLGLAMLGAFGVATLVRWRPDSSISVALGVTVAFLLLNAMVSNGIYDNRMLWGAWLVLLARPLASVEPRTPAMATVQR